MTAIEYVGRKQLDYPYFLKVLNTIMFYLFIFLFFKLVALATPQVSNSNTTMHNNSRQSSCQTGALAAASRQDTPATSIHPNIPRLLLDIKIAAAMPRQPQRRLAMRVVMWRLMAAQWLRHSMAASRHSSLLKEIPILGKKKAKIFFFCNFYNKQLKNLF